MPMTQHMLELIVTAWLGSHLIGVAQMGPMTNDGMCGKHGQSIVRILSKQQRRHHHNKRRVRFDWDCHETTVLKV